MRIAALIGGNLSFVIARYLLRKIVEKCVLKYRKFKLIDAAVKRKGFKVTLLFRLSPLTPYNLFNYFFGLISVKYKSFCIATLVGIIANFFFVY